MIIETVSNISCYLFSVRFCCDTASLRRHVDITHTGLHQLADDLACLTAQAVQDDLVVAVLQQTDSVANFGTESPYFLIECTD